VRASRVVFYLYFNGPGIRMWMILKRAVEKVVRVKKIKNGKRGGCDDLLFMISAMKIEQRKSARNCLGAYFCE